MARNHYVAASTATERTFGGSPVINYAGNCDDPRRIWIDTDRNHVRLRFVVRCRKCRPCLRARQWYWGIGAMHQVEATEASGNRTWFGTLTLNSEAQAEMLHRAKVRWMEVVDHPTGQWPEWWDDVTCDERGHACKRVAGLQ